MARGHTVCSKKKRLGGNFKFSGCGRRMESEISYSVAVGSFVKFSSFELII